MVTSVASVPRQSPDLQLPVCTLGSLPRVQQCTVSNLCRYRLRFFLRRGNCPFTLELKQDSIGLRTEVVRLLYGKHNGIHKQNRPFRNINIRFTHLDSHLFTLAPFSKVHHVCSRTINSALHRALYWTWVFVAKMGLNPAWRKEFPMPLASKTYW